MKRLPLFLAVLLCCTAAASSYAPKRPRILRIAEVRIFSTDLGAARNFYAKVLSAKETSPNAFSLDPQQAVALFAAPSPVPSNLLAEVVFETDNLGGLLRYLRAQKIQVNPNLVMVQHWDVIGPGYSTFSVTDPEGHRISFIERTKQSRPPNPLPTTRPTRAQHIIHAGFIVHDRAAEDHFFKDILGFRLYWYGGMKNDRTDWVAMQVPDGTDWLEYMLNQPMNPDLRLTGVMNHISLGVKDMKAAQAKLESHGWKPHGDEHSQMGKDGKWQLNLFDPDQTRVELMEFTPAEKPCCSEFQ